MKHSLEERMDIGRRMYLHEITYKEAMEIYGLVNPVHINT